MFVAFRVPITYDSSMPKQRLPREVRAYFSKLGMKGGKKGGTARAAKMTPEERSESARKAVQARWEKAKAKTA
jgi:hypothetical protein